MHYILSIIKKYELLSFNPEKGFFKLRVVWLSISILMLIAICISVIILANSELTQDLSYNGFNFFLSAFRFPLGVLALIIPVVAVLAANHRSEQTKEQIKVTNLQNIFSNHYKHIEEFKKYVESLEIEKMDDIQIRRMHKKLFPLSHEGHHDIDKELINELIKTCHSIEEQLKNEDKKISIAISLSKIDFLNNSFLITNNKLSPEMGYDTGLKYINDSLTKIHALLLFSHEHPIFINDIVTKCLVEISKHREDK